MIQSKGSKALRQSTKKGKNLCIQQSPSEKRSIYASPEAVIQLHTMLS